MGTWQGDTKNRPGSRNDYFNIGFYKNKLMNSWRETPPIGSILLKCNGRNVSAAWLALGVALNNLERRFPKPAMASRGCIVFASLLCVFLMLERVAGYPSGAPESACPALSPSQGHGPSKNTDTAPYVLTLSGTSYAPNDVITVRLAGTNGQQFKGFILTARKADGSSTDSIGTFSPDQGGLSKTICQGPAGNVVTHTSNSLKSAVEFQWTAPNSVQNGDIVFKYAVVRSGGSANSKDVTDYYDGLESATLTAANLTKDHECGETKGCYSDCDDDGCSLLVGWAPVQDGISFTMRLEDPGTNDRYLAIGFSTANQMYNASVVACTNIGGTVDVFASYNPGHFNQPLANPKEGLSNINGNFANSVIECTFDRVLSSDNPKIYDLSQPWYLIVAKGPAIPGGLLGPHSSTDRFVTSSMIDFSDVSVDISSQEVDLGELAVG